MSSNIETVPSLLSFFHEELQAAFEKLGVKTSDETGAYLVHLLDGFAKPDLQTTADLSFDVPAAVLLEEALTSSNDQKIDIYRRLGDSSLYSCGFLPEYLSQKTVGMDYYKKMGMIAYQSLADLMRIKSPGGIFDLIFKELAAKFSQCVDAFRLVGFQPGLQLPNFGGSNDLHLPD